MKQDRLYFFLKFAAKEDSLRVLREKLNYLEDAETDAIIKLFNDIGDSLAGKIVGRLMGEISSNPETVNFGYVQKIIEQQKSSGKDKSIKKQKELEALNKSDKYLMDLLKDNPDQEVIRKYSSELGINFYKLITGILIKDSKMSFSNFEEIMNKVRQLPVKYQEWLVSRFGINAQESEIHPIKDCLSVLKAYSEKENGIIDKYKNSQEFRNKVQNKFENKLPNEIKLFSSNQLLNIIDLYATDDLTIKAKSKEKLLTLPQEDLVGRVGDWEVWLPSSAENSCAIARVDPDTLEPLTDWCTARTKSQNLFYDYNDNNRMLFYVIKSNPVSDNDWLSIGFSYGKIIFNGEGSESVNRDNKGLTFEKLASILGGNAQAIMKMISQKCDELGGSSPAFNMQEIKEASTDFTKWVNLKEKFNISGGFSTIMFSIEKIVAEIATDQNILLELMLLDNDGGLSEAIAENENLDVNKVIEYITNNTNNMAVEIPENTQFSIIENNLNIKQLHNLALNAKLPETRNLVLELITDVKTLNQIIKNETEENVKNKAEQIRNYLEKINQIKNTKDQNKLKTIAATYDHKLYKGTEVITTAIEQITDIETLTILRKQLLQKFENEKVVSEAIEDAIMNRLQRLRAAINVKKLSSNKNVKILKIANLFYKTVQAISK